MKKYQILDDFGCLKKKLIGLNVSGIALILVLVICFNYECLYLSFLQSSTARGTLPTNEGSCPMVSVRILQKAKGTDFCSSAISFA